MSDAQLQRLAERAGISVHWYDYRGTPHTVGTDSLRQLLRSLHLAADSPAQVAESLARLDQDARELDPLLTADAGAALPLPIGGSGQDVRYRLVDEHGVRTEGWTSTEHGTAALHAPAAPGYYRLELELQGGLRECTLAVAPARCMPVPAAPGAAPWGIAAQLYSLAEPGDMGLATYASLARMAERAAAHGAAALAVSPTHAMFSADPARRSPYAPSSRLFLNALHIDPIAAFGHARVERTLAQLGAADAARHLHEQALVDWGTAGSLRLALLRALCRESIEGDGEARNAFAEFCATAGDALQAHARFETLHALLGGGGWRDWPAEFHDPESQAAKSLAAEHPGEMQFHSALQWLARRQLDDAQRNARACGMSIGLIADLAIGADPGGSHAWARQSEMLRGLSVGAPPDQLAPQGQSWGLAAFSPGALRRSGFRAFIELLRATMAGAGGLRIDHVLGLQRLWLVPDGGDSSAGAYLAYPVHDLLRLVALESCRHRCVVVGEDLGTVDPALREELAARGLLGMSVMYFEREHGRFVPPAHWRRHSVAMTSTHDLPTLAGWWDGGDIALRAQVGLLDPQQAAAQREERAHERAALWQSIRGGDPDGTSDGGERRVPGRDEFIAEAIAHVGRSAAELALVPLEDVLGTPEAPNLPGTVDEHPNWRRRLPSPTSAELDREQPRRRLAGLAAARAGKT